MDHDLKKKPAGRSPDGFLSKKDDPVSNQNRSSNITQEPASAQAKRRRGRPPGRKSLVGDFELALWIFVCRFLRLADYEAANLVALIMPSDQPIVVRNVEEVASQLSKHLPMTSVKSRSGNLIKRSDVALSTAEAKWIIDSVVHLRLLSESYLSSTMTAADRELKQELACRYLRVLGWTDTLEQIFQRLKTAVSSNAPPTEEELKRKARAFVAALRAAKS